MIKNYILYDKNTGRIKCFYKLPEGQIEQQLRCDEDAYLETEATTDQYVDINTLELVNIPEKPHDYSEFNWQTKQWQDNFEIAKDAALSKRQQLLIESDWTDTYSASTRLTNYNEWQIYRQALRDITKQEGYPFNVIWPTQPV
jgi:hypothetical protein